MALGWRVPGLNVTKSNSVSLQLFLTLPFKVLQFVKVVEQTIRMNDHLWNSYLCKLNHMALMPGSSISSIAQLGFLSCSMCPEGHKTVSATHTLK